MKIVLRLLALVYLALMPYAWADEQTLALLKKINYAANTINYDGVFLHIDDKHVHTQRVIHKIENGAVRERLYALNGPPREVIRDAEKVLCFMPVKKMGHTGFRSDKKSGFPGFMVKNLDALSRNYIISTGEEDRVADRIVTRLQILPRDSFRYGYELWADKKTGLLLKSTLINNTGKTIEQYMFAMIEIGGDIPDSSLLPMTKVTALDWHNNEKPPVNTPLKNTNWEFSTMPDGYRLVNIFHRSLPMEANQAEHLILSDGLAGISVFIEKTDKPVSAIRMDKMGAVNSYTRVIGDYLITAIGEVPADAIKVIGDALVQKN